MCACLLCSYFNKPKNRNNMETCTCSMQSCLDYMSKKKRVQEGKIDDIWHWLLHWSQTLSKVCAKVWKHDNKLIKKSLRKRKCNHAQADLQQHLCYNKVRQRLNQTNNRKTILDLQLKIKDNWTPTCFEYFKGTNTIVLDSVFPLIRFFLCHSEWRHGERKLLM